MLQKKLRIRHYRQSRIGAQMHMSNILETGRDNK